jgi:hypothetical protein
MREISLDLCFSLAMLKSKYRPKYSNDSPVLIVGTRTLLIKSWVVSHLARLARFSHEHKLNVICVNKGHADLTQVSFQVS